MGAIQEAYSRMLDKTVQNFPGKWTAIIEPGGARTFHVELEDKKLIFDEVNQMRADGNIYSVRVKLPGVSEITLRAATFEQLMDRVHQWEEKHQETVNRKKNMNQKPNTMTKKANKPKMREEDLSMEERAAYKFKVVDENVNVTFYTDSVRDKYWNEESRKIQNKKDQKAYLKRRREKLKALGVESKLEKGPAPTPPSIPEVPKEQFHVEPNSALDATKKVAESMKQFGESLQQTNKNIEVPPSAWIPANIMRRLYSENPTLRKDGLRMLEQMGGTERKKVVPSKAREFSDGILGALGFLVKFTTGLTWFILPNAMLYKILVPYVLETSPILGALIVCVWTAADFFWFAYIIQFFSDEK
jgi:hypothetical protein